MPSPQLPFPREAWYKARRFFLLYFFQKFNFSHSVSLWRLICGLLLLYSSLSYIVHCGLLPRQRRSRDPFFIILRGSGTYEMLVKIFDDIIGEYPPEVSSISLHFAGLPQEEIISIFHNKFKFKAINLYRLRHMRGFRYETFQDQERIGIEDGILRLRKTSGTYKNFGNSFHEVWGKAFINYTTILVSLFGKDIGPPRLPRNGQFGKPTTNPRSRSFSE